MKIIQNQTFSLENKLDVTSGLPADNKAILSICSNAEPIKLINCTIKGDDSTEWCLKLSAAKDVIFEDCIITGGNERALDIVKGSNIAFIRCLISRKGVGIPSKGNKYSLSKYCDAGIKGGAHNISFSSCTIGDAMLGDWSCYDAHYDIKTNGIEFLNTHNFSLRIRNAEDVTLTTSDNVGVFVWPKLIQWAYRRWNLWFGDTRKLPY